MKFKEQDLVCARLEVPTGYSNHWLRVLFVDNDETFIGEVERCEWRYAAYQKGEHVRLNVEQVSSIWKEGEEFCYSDDVTICSCPGLCRNK